MIFGNTITKEEALSEGYGIELNGDIIALMESYDDQLNIIKTLRDIDMEEIKYTKLYESSAGAEREEINSKYSAITEGLMTNAWDAIKKFFANLYNKIKGFFKSCIDFFKKFFEHGINSSNGNKYEALASGKYSFESFTVKGYTYSHIGVMSGDRIITFNKDLKTPFDPESSKKYIEFITKLTGLSPKLMNAQVNEWKQNKADIIGAYRYDSLSILGLNYHEMIKLSPEQFTQRLFGFFRDAVGDKAPVKGTFNISNTTIPRYLDALKYTAYYANGVTTKAQKEFEKDYNSVTKILSDLQNRADKLITDDDTIHLSSGDTHYGDIKTKSKSIFLDAARTLASIWSAKYNVSMEVFRAQRSALVEAYKFYLQICDRAIETAKKKS